MININKTGLNKILKGAKAQLLNTGEIYEVSLDGFTYIGDEMLFNDDMLFEGRVKKLAEERLGETVEAILVYRGLGIQHFSEDGENELQAYVKAKVTTEYEITEEYITVATLDI